MMTALEQKAERASQFLNTIQDRLKDHDSPDAKKWAEEVAGLRNVPSDTKTIIGIVGATGAGKSALINALLEEERILPTSCMRACTAVVTEICYNTSDIPYRATIEFISKQQWRAELEVLLEDLLDDNGKIAWSSSYEDTDAGVAYSKIKAVYPGLSKDEIAHTSVEKLMKHKSMDRLGTVKVIAEGDAATFYEKLQVYIDSREKIDLRLKSTTTSSQILQYWPLIRVVRLFVKSEVLKTGAVLVDLPGVHDSNAARAAIAQSYLKQCSSLVIVAPITRAVDDKSAKTLLGQSFKQQLKLDGNLGNVTFVCSKIDEITISEACESLGLAEEIESLDQELQVLEAAHEETRNDHAHNKDRMEAVRQIMDDADQELDMYRTLLSKAQKGDEVTVPTGPEVTSLRKRAAPSLSAQKRSSIKRYFNYSSDDEDSQEETMAEEVETPPDSTDILTVDAVCTKICKLTETKVQAREEYGCLRRKLKNMEVDMEKQAKEYRRESNRLQARKTKICVLARNEYSRQAIRQDFAAGVREIDEELRAENDPKSFDPGEEIRDYRQVACDLPVFCVSSRGYQKLNGRLKSERKAWGFEEVGDTGIPQLQEHCRQTADKLRASSLERFVANVALLCNSLRIWTSNREQQQSLTDAELLIMEAALRVVMDEFSKVLLRSNTALIASIQNDIDTHICNKFKEAVKKAQDKALVTVAKWGSPVNRDDRVNSGLHFATYRATVRRYGFFPKKDMIHDFNRDLADPIVNHIAHGWEHVFARLVLTQFFEARLNVANLFLAFRVKIRETALEHGITADLLQLLDQQMNGYLNALKEALDIAQSEIKETQKVINREFIPKILDDMSQVYAVCRSEYGTGMFERVKRLMESGVKDVSMFMFQKCTDSIEKRLKQMIVAVDQELTRKIASIHSNIVRDYVQLTVRKSQQMLAENELLKDIVMQLLGEYETTTFEEPEALQQRIKTENESTDIVLTDTPGGSLAINAEIPRSSTTKSFRDLALSGSEKPLDSSSLEQAQMPERSISADRCDDQDRQHQTIDHTATGWSAGSR